MVLAISGFEEAFGPGVAVEPVECASNGEVFVGHMGVGDVADEGVDPGAVGREPAGAVVEELVAAADDSCSVDEVSLLGVSGGGENGRG